jgi:hypothetical protein
MDTSRPDNFTWEAPPLSSEDEALANMYREVGRPLDDLPYTEDFKRLVRALGRDPSSDDVCHLLWLRLLKLRKMGRLPRVSGPFPA